MSVVITIQGTVIQFPTSGEPQNWSQPVIDFAVAVQDALDGVVGPADISPQTFSINTFNPGTSVNIPNLTFSTAVVQSAFIRYSVLRSTSLGTVAELGTLNITYNPSNPTGNKWETGQTANGNASISFYVTDIGQVQFTTTTLAGTNHMGTIWYAAQATIQPT